MTATGFGPRPVLASLETEAEAQGRRAGMLLDDPALAGAFARLENDIVAAWRTSPIDQNDAREWLYLRLAALTAVQDELRLMVEQGTLAERERIQHERESIARRAHGVAAGDPP